MTPARPAQSLPSKPETGVERDVCGWWEIELCCSPADQMATLERLLPPGFAFYFREPEENEGLVRAYVPRARVSPEWLGAAFYSLALEARAFGTETPAMAWRSVGSWSLPEAVKQQWLATEVGARLLVLPAWAPVPARTDRVIVRIDPRFGFGDGRHATTALCLEALETLLGRDTGATRPTLADIGCGSGILGIAAIALGAARVYAVDTDAAAIDGTAENRDLNDIPANQMVVQQGSLDRLHAALDAPVDGFFCNVFTDVVAQLLPSFRLISHQGTWGVLSGLQPTDVSMLTAKLTDAGWALTSMTQRDSWCCLVIGRSGCEDLPRGRAP